ncbi:MAG: HNH endonuclease family protein [Paraglaciecola sp.]|uniref:HNH endonuclease family protein n=1 Tax=Paraglaciecola sp. TaxID=1920173 RepID=UPI003297E5CA
MKAVTFFRVVPYSLFLVFAMCIDARATSSSFEPKVKLSSSGICHDQTSASFNRTKKYQAFDTITDCLNQGGRLPKAKTNQIDKATDEAIEQGRAFVTLYDRGDWPHWLDSDKDCQNTRHEMLLQTSTKTVSFKSNKQCNVLTGEWYDPYSSEKFTQSTDLDLDHIVPLKFAHGHGASNWSREQKALFANDSENLILAQASLNRQKGAKGLSEWLPPNHHYRCEYIAQFNKVMTKYNLTYAPSEQRIVKRLVKACNRTV